MTTAARERTRRAILDAAVRVLGANLNASLAEVATEAGVGRTTLHRYFPERADLLAAISTDALERSSAAVRRARLPEGTAPDALARLCREHMELGDLLLLIFNSGLLSSDARWTEPNDDDDAVRTAIARGHREHTIDPGLPVRWVETMLWSLLYSAWEHATQAEVSRHEALDLCLTSLRRALAPP